MAIMNDATKTKTNKESKVKVVTLVRACGWRGLDKCARGSIHVETKWISQSLNRRRSSTLFCVVVNCFFLRSAHSFRYCTNRWNRIFSRYTYTKIFACANFALYSNFSLNFQGEISIAEVPRKKYHFRITTRCDAYGKFVDAWSATCSNFFHVFENLAKCWYLNCGLKAYFSHRFLDCAVCTSKRRATTACCYFRYIIFLRFFVNFIARRSFVLRGDIYFTHVCTYVYVCTRIFFHFL